jgi:hypothetical protein
MTDSTGAYYISLLTSTDAVRMKVEAEKYQAIEGLTSVSETGLDPIWLTLAPTPTPTPTPIPTPTAGGRWKWQSRDCTAAELFSGKRKCGKYVHVVE